MAADAPGAVPRRLMLEASRPYIHRLWNWSTGGRPRPLGTGDVAVRCRIDFTYALGLELEDRQLHPHPLPRVRTAPVVPERRACRLVREPVRTRVTVGRGQTASSQGSPATGSVPAW